MTLDEKRGLVFVPTGSAAADFYGANRLGDNLYANCLLALDAATGKLRWHFQFVRHDVLDRDLPSAPTLVTLRRNGASRSTHWRRPPSRDTCSCWSATPGKPVFPIEELPAPASDVPGEVAEPTLPAADDAGALARQQLSAEDTHDAHSRGQSLGARTNSPGCAATGPSSR